MKNFKVGDTARVTRVRNACDNVWYVGAIVEIVEIGNNKDTRWDNDCTVLCSDGRVAYPKIDQLEPLTKPKVGSWEKIEEKLGWNPTKVEEIV